MIQNIQENVNVFTTVLNKHILPTKFGFKKNHMIPLFSHIPELYQDVPRCPPHNQELEARAVERKHHNMQHSVFILGSRKRRQSFLKVFTYQ